jgi:large subunit ribosomal protein L25
MEVITVTGQVRKNRGKGSCRQLRRNGRIPGILYGGETTRPVSLDVKTFKNLLSSGLRENTIFQFNLEGEDRKECRVLMRELQIHPATRALLHVDLYEVSMDKEVVVNVPIVLTGNAIGVAQEEGLLHHQLKELSLACLPGLIPEHIEVDVSELHMGDAVHVKDLKLAEGIKVLTDHEETVVSIAAPAKEEAPPEEALIEGAPVGEAAASEEG